MMKAIMSWPKAGCMRTPVQMAKTLHSSPLASKFRPSPSATRKTARGAVEAEAPAATSAAPSGQAVVFNPPNSMKIAVFSSQPYVTDFLKEPIVNAFPNTVFYQARLDHNTADLAEGFDAVNIFVNDDAGTEVIHRLHECGVKLITLRCAGFDRVDLATCRELGIRVVRVPTYSPEAVAEHAVALMLALNRKLHKAYARTREGNFSLSGLVGSNKNKKIVAVLGTGAIGKVVCSILKLGFKCDVRAYDVREDPEVVAMGIKYYPLEECITGADCVSLHVPLLPSTQHLIQKRTLDLMKPGATLINVSRGGLIDSDAVIEALRVGHLGALGIDVFEHEESIFFEDRAVSDIKLRAAWDSRLALLMSLPNVLVTPHSAFLTREALKNIADTTIENLNAFATGQELLNEVKPRGFQKVGGSN